MGCGDDAAPVPADAGAPIACDEVAAACPAAHPQPGGLCEGALSCPYPDEVDPSVTWTYDCTAGVWTAMSDCMLLGGGCPAPPLAESCSPAFSGMISGATIEIGPADASQPFRAFGDGEVVTPVVGGQGAAMIPFRVRVSGAAAPDCVLLERSIALTASGMVATIQSPVVLRCGQSLAVFIVLPALCEPGVYDAQLHVVLQGIGEATAHVMFEAPPCFD